jgi:hypothetical protein
MRAILMKMRHYKNYYQENIGSVQTIFNHIYDLEFTYNQVLLDSLMEECNGKY